ncbi:MAG: hypothetical protein HYU64_03795 [Armatimonadetes bacterium]|nr:hypothetical protein [Armatimonadota bacterium]
MCGGGMGAINPYQLPQANPYGAAPFGGATPLGGAQPYGAQPFPAATGFTPTGIQPPASGGNPAQMLLQVLQSLVQILQKMVMGNGLQQLPGQGLPGQANHQNCGM